MLLYIGVSQNVIPPAYNFGVAMPMAFTEQGVAMLSSVLRSKVAIEVNISIMRAFVLMRQMAIGYEELSRRIEELEVSTDVYKRQGMPCIPTVRLPEQMWQGD